MRIGTSSKRTARSSARAALAAAATLAALVMGCAAAGQAEKTAAADPVCDEVKKLQGPAREEVVAFARLLALRPAMAIDMTRPSGEYCLNTGDHVMAHFSTRPEQTGEDIVYFVDAAPLVAKGLRLEDFPALDPGLGKMQSNTWYRYEGKGTEPHHGMEMGDRKWIMLAVDVK